MKIKESITVTRKPGNFTVVSNAWILAPGLSWKAKGLFLYLCSRPPGWQTCIADLIKRSTDGRDAVLSGLGELVAMRYLERRKVRDAKGVFITTEYTIHEEPGACGFNPQPGFPAMDKPDTDNPPLIRTDSSKKECKTVGDPLLLDVPPDTKPIAAACDVLTAGPMPVYDATPECCARALQWILAKRKRVTWTPRKFASTCKAIATMERVDKIPMSEVYTALTFYSDHCDGQYALVIESGITLRAKFDRLMIQMQRAQNGFGRPEPIDAEARLAGEQAAKAAMQ